MRIISRRDWGGGPVRQARRVNPNDVVAFVCHYHDGNPQHRTGAAVPKFIESLHRGRGWSDIGYNYVIDINGVCFEGRGLNVLGAHAGTGYGNRQVGVQFHIGGSQRPTGAMLKTARDLHQHLSGIYRRELLVTGHNDYSATECPGPHKQLMRDFILSNSEGSAMPNEKDFRKWVRLELFNPPIPGHSGQWGASVLHNAAQSAYDIRYRVIPLLEELGKKQGIDVSALAAGIADEMRDDIRAIVIEAGGAEDFAERVADVFADRLQQ